MAQRAKTGVTKLEATADDKYAVFAVDDYNTNNNADLQIERVLLAPAAEDFETHFPNTKFYFRILAAFSAAHPTRMDTFVALVSENEDNGNMVLLAFKNGYDL